MIKIKGWDLAYFQSGEWQVIEERLDDYDKSKRQYNPVRRNLFAALSAVPRDRVRAVIMGQDPYPQSLHATGIAFATPVGSKTLPPTLVNLFQEYSDDLHYPAPENGDLKAWVNQGVLLWNAYPSCFTGRPGSHHWDEWTFLTKEIVEQLDNNPVVFAFLGKEAQKFNKYVNYSPVINTSHPSPLGVNHGFKGSRLFSTINDHLRSCKLETIEWRL